MARVGEAVGKEEGREQFVAIGECGEMADLCVFGEVGAAEDDCGGVWLLGVGLWVWGHGEF